MKREHKEFGPKVRLIINILQQIPVVYLFCKVDANILLKFLGLFASNSMLITSILLLILVRYLLCSSRLIILIAVPLLARQMQIRFEPAVHLLSLRGKYCLLYQHTQYNEA
jgi:hypothetical protein